MGAFDGVDAVDLHKADPLDQVVQGLARGGPCLIVCGGAILDFLGGKVSRAPLWLRRLGGEWIFRLMREPKRLFMRYVVGNPLFLLRALMCTKAMTLDARNTPRRT